MQLHGCLGNYPFLSFNGASPEQDPGIRFPPHVGDNGFTREDGTAETAVNAFKAGGVVFGKLPEDSTGGKTEGTQPMQNGPVIAANGRHLWVGM